MATQQYVLDESFEFLGTTDGTGLLTFYNGKIISESNPVPAHAAVVQVASALGSTGGRCVTLVAATVATGSDSIGITQEPVTSPHQIIRVRTLGISKARCSAVAVAANDFVCAATSLGRVAKLTMAAPSTRTTTVYYVLGKARTLSAGTIDELIEVFVNPIAI